MDYSEEEILAAEDRGVLRKEIAPREKREWC